MSQNHLPPNSDFSLDFAHFILEILENPTILAKIPKKCLNTAISGGTSITEFRTGGDTSPASPRWRRPWARVSGYGACERGARVSGKGARTDSSEQHYVQWPKFESPPLLQSALTTAGGSLTTSLNTGCAIAYAAKCKYAGIWDSFHKAA